MSPVPPPPSCPDENVLAAFASGALPPVDISGVAAHLDACEDCRALVAVVAAEDSLTDVNPHSQVSTPAGHLTHALLREGTRLGPYVLRELLGVGGMGVVYAAEDPRLARRVAVKLLRPMAESEEGEGRTRLSREAQAMARLSHPNVLPVFELGASDGCDYLVMEWVEGTTLAGWLRERERSWEEVLETFLAAGAGLVAAHREGLVHRDFKPSNVLVGKDGRARVMDFGLARRWRSGDPAAPVAPSTSPTDLEQTVLTREGAAPGTPAYMSPEQRQGLAVDARSDQYSFCVALHEALHGERPSEALARRSSKVPRHLQAALAQGLAREPSARHSSMEALLQALSTPATAKSPRWGWGAVALGVVLGLALWKWRGDEWVPLGDSETSAFHQEVEAARKGGGNIFFPLVMGEPRTLELSNLSRIAIGQQGLVNIQTVENGLLLTPLESGASHLLVWTRAGERRLYTVSVSGK
ncbi:serine/threonine protein kinase [Myxococcus stipitatus DSM 14675]|uniref:Serine/threonine protein kinase n=1 Tax=Myxococcus stipitatus (strain DSM 14675 / JCM 12634 / Mx s8) TaxID=1278073 RepID=L7U0P1_MYXSD|nr:protein kinase [Myxococcus stipitatus]AGC41420.1 serine/threonine protein kinase [Myxococcus stipitatus DSM 14675]